MEKSMKRITIFLLIISLILTGSSLFAGKRAPGFALMDNTGQFVYKSKLQGNLIISFWASYCAPCKKEMPHLVKFEQKYGKTKDLKLILINVDKSDRSGTSIEKGERTLNEIGVNHVFLLDMYHMALKKYNKKKSVPSTFLVDKSGQIVFSEIGAKKNTLTRLEKAIQKLR